MNTYMLAWSCLCTQPSYMGACCVAVYMEVNMKKGDLVKEIKTKHLYLVRAISVYTGRDWLFVEPINEGRPKWQRGKEFEVVRDV